MLIMSELRVKGSLSEIIRRKKPEALTIIEILFVFILNELRQGFFLIAGDV